MKYIFLILLAHFLWSAGYYIDRVLINKMKVEHSISNIMVSASLVANVVILPIFLFLADFQLIINKINLFLALAATISLLIALYSYLLAIKNLKSNVVSLLFQLLPVFSFIISYVLGELFSFNQILGSILVIISALIISFDAKININKKSLFLMVISSFGYAIFYFIFVNLANRTNFYQATIFYQIGLIIFGLFLIINSKIRKEFFGLFVEKPQFIILNIINELGNAAADLLINFTMLFLPIALVNSMSGIGPMLTVVVGLIGVKLLPKYFDEKPSKTELIKLIIAIIFSASGIFVMFN